jgi:hypothetical protein
MGAGPEFTATMEAVETILSPGTILSGRYRIESVLGQGGMGSVYLARLLTLGDKPVAIKEMRLDTTGSGDPKMQEAAVAQFRQEAQFLANLEHPNLVQVSDFFEENGRSFLVMAYVKGQTLADMLKERRGAFPVQRAGMGHAAHRRFALSAYPEPAHSVSRPQTEQHYARRGGAHSPDRFRNCPGI